MNPSYSTLNKAEPTKVKPSARQSVADELAQVLAQSYVLYLKTQNYHWNVTGTLFGTLHRIFDEQYHELADAVDKIAERMRAIGAYAPATFKQFSELCDLNEDTAIPPAAQMIQNLVDSNERLTAKLRDSVKTSDKNEDIATSDLLIKRIRVHDKNAWMLRSFLKDNGATTQSAGGRQTH